MFQVLGAILWWLGVSHASPLVWRWGTWDTCQQGRGYTEPDGASTEAKTVTNLWSLQAGLQRACPIP